MACEGHSELHIGAVYNRIPADPSDTTPLLFKGREVVIDIDKYKSCADCVDKIICVQCWAYEMLPRMQKANEIMRDVFKCESVTAFYSGRRGGHLFVRDLSLFVSRGYVRQILHRQLEHFLNQREGSPPVKKEDPCYIEIDEGAMTGETHLIRHPFSVHPKSGRLNIAVDLVHATSDPPFVYPVDIGIHSFVSETFNRAVRLLES